MCNRRSILLLLQAACWLAVVFLRGELHPARANDKTGFFETRIRPALIKHCYECHSDRSEDLQGDLLLDRNLTKAAPLITVGDPEKSLLIEAIRYTNSDLQMPPSGRLPRNLIADFEQWVRDGAADSRPANGDAQPARPKSVRVVNLNAGRQFWSFRPVSDAPPPAVADGWIRSPIDAFILARLRQADLRPARPADRRTLIRRASFVLTGLPPTPEQVDKFLEDRNADAFARLVDRLLASPDYGERWARHWLDVVRYGDCNGADESRPFPNAWHFRNYVIDSFNRDVPYDRLITEHLAGDLIEHDGDSEYEPLVGTGFLVIGTKILAEQDSVKMRVDIVDEQIDAFSRSMLALTLACARCHDHKFDPIPTSDYYALAGIFGSTKTMAGYGKWLERPAHTAETLRAAQQYSQQVAPKRKALEALVANIDVALADANVIQLEAEKFTRGNATIETTNYGKGIGIIGDTGKGGLNHAEFDIEIRRPGRYLVQLRYAAQTARPGRFLLNGEVARDPAITETTGGWHPAQQKWNDEGTHEFKAGTNTLRFESKPLMVHIDKLRLLPVDEATDFGQLLRQRERLAAEIRTLEDKAKPPLTVMAVDEARTRNSRIHIRGSHLKLGEEVPRRFLQVVTGEPQAPLPEGQSGRLQLAQWMTHPDHPLTARVMVNRIWHWHFGRGLVATPDNFGEKGERPTHPKLLDFLARRFVELNWSIKALHREIMLSSTWQMSAARDMERAVRNTSETIPHSERPGPESVDPDNRLYWRRSPRRLEAEAIRDALLAISGRLDRQIGGASLKLKTIALSPEDLDGHQKHYDQSNRRSVYLPVLRTNVYDFLTLFDFANPDLPTGRRVTTTVPTQALLIMNSDLVKDCASRLAVRCLADSNGSQADVLTQVYLTLFGRPPRGAEQALARQFLDKFTNGVSGDDPEQARAWTALCQTLIASNAFVYLR